MDRRRAGAIGAATGSFLLIAWVAASDQVKIWEEMPSRRGGPPGTPPPRPITVAPTDTLPEITENDSEPLDLSFLLTIGGVLLAALGLYLLVRVVMMLRRKWLHRAQPATGPTAEFDVLPDMTETLAEVIADPDDLLSRGSPRNAIVRCWMRLCDAVDDAGLRPDPSETSSELTERVLGAYVVDRRAITTLAALYREARFSEHELPETARQRAVDALGELDEQLRRRRDAEAPSS